MERKLKIVKAGFMLHLGLCLTLVLFGCTKTARVEVLGHEMVCFEVEIADSFFKRTLGLMFRKRLAKDHGMLFLYPKPAVMSFWMKNTRVPLDIIFIKEDRKIANIEEATPCTQRPCRRYHSRGKIMYVLEINQGLTDLGKTGKASSCKS